VTILHAIVLALAQGVSELFPVSSLGHAVLIPHILKWGINEQDKTWLAFLVALHLGTGVALLAYFRQEWVRVVTAFVASIRERRVGEDPDRRLAWLVIAGTVPAGIVGVVLEKPLRHLFGSPYVAASMLIVNGLILLVGEHFLRRQAVVQGHQRGARRVGAAETVRGRYREISELAWKDAVVVGMAQVGALIPGISRSGVTMVAGLTAGLTYEAAARYAFLLATPAIGAAGLLELPDLAGPHGRGIIGQAILGALLAGIAAYLSVRFLMRYFQSGKLAPFGYYSIIAGALSLVFLVGNV
jgi:undecaprenyl-diphosphatase